MQRVAHAADASDELIGSGVVNRDTARAIISEIGRVSLARFAWFVVAYNIIVIVWGAYVRATGSGAGCGGHWPLCNGEFVPTTPQVQTVIEFTHRVTSALSLVLVATLFICCWRRTAEGEWPRYSAAAAAILLLNEAFLGAMLVLLGHVGMDRSAGRAVFLSMHFCNTLLLVAALALTAKWLSSGARSFVPSRIGFERVVIVVGLVCVMAAGMTGSLAALGDTIFPMESLKDALAQDFSSNGSVLLRLRIFHPVVATIAFFFGLWIVRKLSKKREESWGIIAFLIPTLLAQVALGVLNVLLLATVWLQLTHLLVGEVLWVLLVLASADLLFSGQPFNEIARGMQT